jgi:pimeloyl-ACP methyl ester carboxylesterase
LLSNDGEFRIRTMKDRGRIMVWTGLLVLAAAAALGGLSFRYGRAPLAHPGPGSINELTQVELGGLRQWISIRGGDSGNPVLLFLHGGPGSANLAKLRVQCPALEDHFTVVSWDQRGSGKTNTLQTGGSGLTLEQMRSDARQLTAYLRERFGGRKIYLMGFSWGTVLGLWTVQDRPEDFLGYIGVGQIVNYAEGEKLSLEYVRRIARETGNRKAADELAGIDPAYRTGEWYDDLMTQRRWLLAFGGVYRTADSYGHELRMLLEAPEYSLADAAWWPLGSGNSLRRLWTELMAVDFFDSAPRIGVPVYFLSGRHDYNAPSELTQAFYERLDAPRGKEMIWFEDSAHDVFFDQPEMLTDVLMDILREV